MNKNIKRTYLTPKCLCAEIDNEELLCQSQFNTNDPEEMEEDDEAGVKAQGIFQDAFSY